MPDLPDIHEDLQKILTAIYGEEVRFSIYDALYKMRNLMDDWNSTAMTGKAKLTALDDLDTMYESGMWWYSSASGSAPQHWPIVNSSAGDTPIFGRLVIFGGSSNYPATKVQMVFSIDGKMVYRYGTSVSEWGDWMMVSTTQGEEENFGVFSTALTRDTILEYGFDTFLDLPVNKMYRIYASVPDSFGLPHSASRASLMVWSPKSHDASWTGRYFFLAQGGELYWMSSSQSELGWQKVSRVLSNEDEFKVETDMMNRSKLTELGYSSLSDMPGNRSYRFGTGLNDIGLPDTDTGGAALVKWRPAGQTASTTAIMYLCAMNKRLWWKSESSGDGWEIIHKDLPLRHCVCIGASTLTGAITGSSAHSKYVYPYYLGKMGNFIVHNLAVGGTDFVTGLENNYMAIVSKSENEDILKNADLITINVGGNDYNFYTADSRTQYGATEAERQTFAANMIGEWDDYFNYTGSETSAKLHADCTKAGAANFILYKLSRMCPKAQIIMVFGPIPPGGTSFGAPESEIAASSLGKMSFTPATNAIASHDNKSYFDLCYEVFKPLCEHARIPLVDARATMMNAYNKGSDKYSGVHPLEDFYEAYSKPVASMILANFRN